MRYEGKYSIFDPKRIRPYPIAERMNKSDAGRLVVVKDLLKAPDELSPSAAEALDRTSQAIAAAVRAKQPVIWIGGAHFIKACLAPIALELMDRGALTLWGGNGAASIHDFEFALIGQTSEYVPNALPVGKFGMAAETGKYMNDCMAEAHRRGLGQGEALGRMVAGEAMPYAVKFPHGDLSVLARAYRRGIPATVHTTIGTDIPDQHPNFDPAAKGATSGADFLIFVAEIERIGRAGGGVVLNVGSAVTGPEVLLKAVSMAANVGSPPRGLTCADFDMRDAGSHAENEDRQQYYYRDIKSVVTRIPNAFGGCGVYVQGDLRKTLPALYRRLHGLLGW